MESQFFLLYLRKLIQKNTMEKKLAIKGHPTRGKEVIELLEMMGGVNVDSHKGHFPDEWKSSYYIYGDNTIQFARDEFLLKLNFVIFTLEEFLEKFPYKVGDKVKLYYQDEEEDRYCSAIPSTIIGMRWDKSRGEVAYKMKGIKRECYKDEISYDNNNEHSAVIADINLNRADYADEVEINLGDYEIEVRDGRTFAVLKKPTYPTNYQECCQVLGLPMQNALEYINKDCNKHDYYNDLQSTLNCFVSLKICRDAYWKIAGEQMGLGKLWKPDFTNDDEERYGIYTAANKVVKDFCGVGDVNTILTFPTEEMRDAFFNAFREDIEKCKELL